MLGEALVEGEAQEGVAGAEVGGAGSNLVSNNERERLLESRGGYYPDAQIAKSWLLELYAVWQTQNCGGNLAFRF